VVGQVLSVGRLGYYRVRLRDPVRDQAASPIIETVEGKSEVRLNEIAAKMKNSSESP
jgi:hypothetical protein